ncbi:hypothetical protein ACFSQD_09890 [Flavihumibacter stibioxidans]|nr:hypothetical protein [Flavihumibacter stibioxidans]
MKRGLGLLLAVSLAFAVQAQQPMEGIAEFQKKNMPAAVLELPYPPDVVEKAMEEKFKTMGFKPAKAKDYQLYRNVPLGDGGNLYDVYVKVDRKSRKEKAASLVQMIMAKPNEMLSSRAADERTGIEDGKTYLAGVTPFVADYNLNLEILAQESLIDKMEKKHTSMLDEGADLAKRKVQIEEKIAENSNAVKQHALDLEKARQALQAIRARKLAH